MCCSHRTLRSCLVSFITWAFVLFSETIHTMYQILYNPLQIYLNCTNHATHFSQKVTKASPWTTFCALCPVYLKNIFWSKSIITHGLHLKNNLLNRHDFFNLYWLIMLHFRFKSECQVKEQATRQIQINIKHWCSTILQRGRSKVWAENENTPSTPQNESLCVQEYIPFQPVDKPYT